MVVPCSAVKKMDGMASIAVIAGLGNPGEKYRMTRHNAGFLVVEELARRLNVPLSDQKWKAEFGRGRARVPRGDGSEITCDVVLLKPLDFMNHSGRSVGPALKFFQAGVDDLLVVHDESEIAFAELRTKVGGGHKGHNGLRDIIDQTGSRDFHRLRVGVGRPAEGRGLADYLLGPFSKDEQGELPHLVDRAVDESLKWLAARAG